MRSGKFDFTENPLKNVGAEMAGKPEVVTEEQPPVTEEAQPKNDEPAPKQAPAAPQPSFFERYKVLIIIALVVAIGFFFWKFKIVPKVPVIPIA